MESFFMKKQAEQWLHAAETDLLAAKEIIHNHLLTSVTAFHVQQCIEKALKALIANSGKTIPHIHDLRRLKHLAAQMTGASLNAADNDLLDQINQVYIDARYPADIGLLPEGTPSQEKANTFLIFAETLYSQIQKIISADSRDY